MLRKLIFLALASGLAKKGYDLYKARGVNEGEVLAITPAKPRRVAARRARPAPAPTHHRATTVGESG